MTENTASKEAEKYGNLWTEASGQTIMAVLLHRYENETLGVSKAIIVYKVGLARLGHDITLQESKQLAREMGGAI